MSAAAAAATSPLLDVMLVDDEPDVRLMLRMHMVRAPDFGEIIEASGGMDALVSLPDPCPDAVVLDLRMPGLNGLETARRIKDVCPDTKIILFSAFLSDEVIAKSADAGVDLCLPKWARPGDVLEMIRHLCAA